MRHTRWIGRGAAPLVLLLAGLRGTAAPAPGAASALAQVPADAQVVVYLHGLERTQDRLGEMVKNALPDLGPKAVEQFRQQLEAGFMGRKPKGLPKDGAIFVVLPEIPNPAQQPPKMAVVLAVTRYTDFRDSVLNDDERKALKTDPAGYDQATVNDQEVYFIDHKNGYAVVTPSKDVATQLAHKPEKGLDTRLKQDAAQKLLDSDLGVYVDMEAVNKQHGDAIKQGKETFLQALEQNTPDKATVAMMQRVLGAVFQAVEDSRTALATVEFRPAGLALHMQAAVGEDTKTGALLKESRPSALRELGSLPAGWMIYTGMEIRPTLFKKFGTMMFGIATDPDSAEAKELQAAADELAAARPTALVGVGDVPMRGLQVWTFADPRKAAAAQLKAYKAIKSGTFGSMALKEPPQVKADAEKYEGFELHSALIRWDIEKTVEKQTAGKPIPEQAKQALIDYQKKLLGEEMNIWFGTDGKTYVQVMAKDWSAARKILDAYREGKSKVGDEKAFTAARGHLPQDVTVVGLIDVPRYAEVIVEAVKPMLRGMGVPFNLPSAAVKGKTTYLALDAVLRPGHGSFDLWLPGAAANEVYKMYIEKLLKGGAGGNP
jgi:hypothetical protein